MLVDFLKRDLGLKIISIILAIMLWSYVKYTSSPQSTLASEARINVALSVEALQDKLIALDIPKEVSLIVEGDPQILSQVKPANFKAFINLDNKRPGLYNVPVKVTSPPDVKVLKIEPGNIQARIDPIAKQLFSVKIKPQGSVASGFILSQISTQPESVTVSGAQSIISRVKEVRAICDVDGADTDLLERISLDTVGEDDKILENLKVEPSFIRTTIKVRPEVKSATIPIFAVITGSPMKGHKISKIILTPPTANVRYRYSLESPPVSIKTEEISLNGAKGAITKDVGLVVPSDVSLVEPKSVRVKIVLTQQNNTMINNTFQAFNSGVKHKVKDKGIIEKKTVIGQN